MRRTLAFLRRPAILRDPVYRAFCVVLLLKGVAFGAALPFLALWLTDNLHATLLDVGLLRSATGFVTLACALVAARATDRTSRRHAWIVTTLLLEGVAWLVLTSVTSVPLAIGIASLGNLSAIAQLFASLADWTEARRSSISNTVQSTVRMFFSLGWLAGPALGGLLMATGGATALFAFTGCVTLLAAAIAARSLTDPPARPDRPSSAARASGRRALLVFYAALVLAFAADGATRTTLLPIYVTDALGIRVSSYGLLLTAGIVLELPAFLLAGRMADRHGTPRVVAAGLLSLAASFVVLAAFPSFWGVAVAEVIRVVYVAAIHGSAVVHLQRLLPGRSGLAMAFYTMAFQLAPAVAAPLLSVAIARMGWSRTFSLCVVLALGAVLLMAIRGRPYPRASTSD